MMQVGDKVWVPAEGCHGVITAPCSEGECKWFVALIGKPVLAPFKPWDIELVEVKVVEGKVEYSDLFDEWLVDGDFVHNYVTEFDGETIRMTIERVKKEG
jgi:hypothetical protein